jgi:hypothetical protein
MHKGKKKKYDKKILKSRWLCKERYNAMLRNKMPPGISFL